DEILPYVDLVLVMSVNPGFGGQKYIQTSTRKVARMRQRLEGMGIHNVEVEVDGGISPVTAPEVARAGATVLVAGNAVFNTQASVAANITALRQAVGGEGAATRPAAARGRGQGTSAPAPRRPGGGEGTADPRGRGGRDRFAGVEIGV